MSNPIAISSGHGKYISGANDIMKEHDEAVKVVNRVAEILTDGGVDVVTFEDTTSRDQNTNLKTIVDWHNSQDRQLDVSVHFDSDGHTSGPLGTSCLYTTQKDLSAKVSSAVSAASGLKDRGASYRPELYFLAHTTKPAILIETCFVTSQTDVDLYHAHFEAICQAIAETIYGQALGPAPVEEDLPPKFPQDVITQLCQIASSSVIASYSWKDRGRAPPGYINGMACAYAQAVQRYIAGDPVMLEMGKANTHNDSVDAISWYNSNFAGLGMSNSTSSMDTMRHLYMLLMGLGMRESSGQYCCGRDQSASNTSSDTAEAGLFQTSWNAHTCSKQFDTLADQYDKDSPQGYQSVFAQGVSCSSSDWTSYGSGAGFNFQETCKWSPVYAVETCAITLRNLRQHYGPINRKEAELNADADVMFLAIEYYVKTLPPWVPGQPPVPSEPTELEVLLASKPTEISPDDHIQWLVDSMDYILRHQ